MSGSEDAKIPCESCGRTYRWNDKYAGRKVQCKCGAVMRFPDRMPGDEPAQQEEDVYALNTGDDGIPMASEAPAASAGASAKQPADDGHCPECAKEVRPGAIICINCGYNLKEGKKLTTDTEANPAPVPSLAPGRTATAAYTGTADGFFGKISRSWEFAKLSYGIIWDFKRLIVFPIFSGIAAVLVLASFILPLWGLGYFEAKAAATSSTTTVAVTPAEPTEAGNPTAPPAAAAPPAPAPVTTAPATATVDATVANAEDAEGGWNDEADQTYADSGDSVEMTPVDYAILFAFYFCNYFVIVFFNTALIACAMKVVAGEVPTVGYGLSIAFKRLPQIVAWAAISAVVGVLLKVIENANKKVGKIIAAIIGTAWTILTYFVVPVLAVEGVGPVQAIKQSASVLKQTWGEAAIGNFSLGLLNFLICLPVYLILGVLLFLSVTSGNMVFVAAVLAIGAVALVVTAAVSSAADVVFKALLYNYATGRSLPANVDADIFAAAFAPAPEK